MDTGLEQLTVALADRYRIGRELGSGGMATVYEAQDLRHNRTVALKLLRPDLTALLGAERFLAEIRTTASLQHPHILPLFDSGQAAGQLFYVMPRVEGESLRARLTRERMLPIADAIQIAREVAAALEHAHRRGVIHRDIKPENILLQEGAALVADFGIALALSSAGGSTRLTETGLSLGTPHYMSPEQALGERTLDARSDVYAVGAVLYEMLTGEPPFTGSTAQAIVARLMTEAPRSIRAVRDTVSPGLERAVLTALQKVPADRHTSAAAFSTALAGAGTAPTVDVAATSPALADGQFLLTEAVCRRLARSSFDPRLIGTPMHYLDNGVSSDLLVCLIPAGGCAADYYAPILRDARYHAVAPTLRGFEPTATWRPTLTVEDHIVLIRELLRDVAKKAQPRLVVIAGFSSGGDFALRFAAAPDPAEPPLHLNGCLALGTNLAGSTCFLSSQLAKLAPNDPASMLTILRQIADSASTLEEWVSICDYIVRIVPPFRQDATALRLFGEGISAPFVDAEPLVPFAEWYRAARARGCHLRTVFEDTPMYQELVRELQLRTLEEGLLGPQYEPGSIVTEAGTRHLDLMEATLVNRHVEALRQTLLA